jgi:hypothetical protein
MATITLKYDARNPMTKKTLDYILSIGFSEVKKHKTSLQEYKGAMTKQSIDEIDEQLNELRNAWE